MKRARYLLAMLRWRIRYELWLISTPGIDLSLYYPGHADLESRRIAYDRKEREWMKRIPARPLRKDFGL